MRLIKSVLAAWLVLVCQHALAQQVYVYVPPPGVPAQAGEGPVIKGLGPSSGYSFVAQSLSQSVAANPGIAPGVGGPKPQFADLTLTKAVGPASQALMHALLTGHPLPSVTIDFVVNRVQGPFLDSQFVLQNVFVRGMQRNYTGANAIDTITLFYTNFTWTQNGTTSNGTPLPPLKMQYDAIKQVLN